MVDLGTAVQEQLARRFPEHVARLHWTAEQVREHQRRRLRALLAHASEHSVFHARRLRGIDADAFELSDLAGLPVMTKTEMMANFDEVVTDRRLTRPVVEEHLARSTDRPSLLLGEYVCLVSGGSSGVRGVFVQTVSEFVVFFASLRRRTVAAAAASSSQPIAMALVAAAAPVHSSAFTAALLTGGPLHLVSVPATLPIDEVVARLNTLQPAILTGYPSILVRLAAEQQAGRLRISPRSVTATSEQATEHHMASIAAGFGVAVVNQFASTEGLVGHTEPGDPLHVFASDMCIAELVDDGNRPVEDATPSAKVLLTNLHNFTQPLIRYELTDRFIRQPAGRDGHLRAIVAGRADDVFRYDDVVVHPHVVRTVMVRTPAVAEYQVRQTVDGIDVDIVTSAPAHTAALRSALAASLEHAGLLDPNVAIRDVTNIDRHPQTGKVRRFVPLAK